MSVDVSYALPEGKATRRAFDRARNFDDASFVHDETRQRLLDRLGLIRLEPRVVVDLGAATGRGALSLAERYPAAQVLALDTSAAMLLSARQQAHGRIAPMGGDAERLPLRPGRVDLLFANLVLPWCRPDRFFAEAARVLSDGGALLFATLGPDTLAEVRHAFAAVDDQIHVHGAVDMHDLGDLALAAGLAEPVLDVDRLEVTYTSPVALVADLRATGSMNVAGGRRRTLTGPRRWAAFARRLNPIPGQRFAVTVELVLGQAWGRGIGSSGREPGHAGEFTVPIERIVRRLPHT
jgi:malonyl-CoA O-methyltransferase